MGLDGGDQGDDGVAQAAGGVEQAVGGVEHHLVPAAEWCWTSPLALLAGLMTQWLTDPEHAPGAADITAGLRALTDIVGAPRT